MPRKIGVFMEEVEFNWTFSTFNCLPRLDDVRLAGGNVQWAHVVL